DWSKAQLERPTIRDRGTTTGDAVDSVIRPGRHLLPLVVKAAPRVRPADARHLRTFRAEYPDRALPGLLIYTGKETYWLTEDVLAVPRRRVVGEICRRRRPRHGDNRPAAPSTSPHPSPPPAPTLYCARARPRRLVAPRRSPAMPISGAAPTVTTVVVGGGS